MTLKQTKRKLSLTSLVIGLAIVLGLVQLFISHRLATAGESVRILEARAAELEQINLLLEEEIAQTGSLQVVAKRAEELGFVRTDQVVYLTSPVPVALGKTPN